MNAPSKQDVEVLERNGSDVRRVQPTQGFQVGRDGRRQADTIQVGIEEGGDHYEIIELHRKRPSELQGLDAL